MSAVIKVENLGKRYLIGHRAKEQFPTFRDAMVRGGLNIGRRIMHPLKASAGNPLVTGGEVEDFWALKDVSFEIKQGERIGIIGRNGAGKSTLLKILSRITEPTTGRVSMKGRVASLLEVGTGFHPELTGRENVYLNGAILGMSKEDIRRRFDEIVDFAGVEKFLDTPVKRYSSGMRVRLGFSVAAHLEPEILIIDEVLAVGDAHFQKKCLSKIQEVGNAARTVLFVSHNIGIVKDLCERGILLKEGKLFTDGSVLEAIGSYKSLLPQGVSLLRRVDRHGSGEMLLADCKILDEQGHTIDEVFCGKDLVVKIQLVEKGLLFKNGFTCSISINSICGQRVSLMRTSTVIQSDVNGKGFLTCKVLKPNLNIGRYYLNVSLHSDGQLLDWVESCAVFDVVNSDSELSCYLPGPDRMVFFRNLWS